MLSQTTQTVSFTAEQYAQLLNQADFFKRLYYFLSETESVDLSASDILPILFTVSSGFSSVLQSPIPDKLPDIDHTAV